jgi:hypothetical protein
MENAYYILLIHLIKMTNLTNYQIENLVKLDKCPSKWPWLSQIGHIEWIRFSQINRSYLTLSQIDHYDLTFSQMNHTL